MKKQTCYVERDPKKTELNEGFLRACQHFTVQNCDSGLMVLTGYSRTDNIVEDVKAIAAHHGQTGIKVSPDLRNG